eukprot:5064588-Prymnesium_polylepis.1
MPTSRGGGRPPSPNPPACAPWASGHGHIIYLLTHLLPSLLEGAHAAEVRTWPRSQGSRGFTPLEPQACFGG